MKLLKRRNFIISGVSILLACLMVLSGVQVGRSLEQKDSVTVGFGLPTIKIGMEGVAAAGTADYTCSGVNDDVVVQTALNALPSNGGKLQFLSGNYSFSATVSRIIPNVMIEGDGASTRFTFDGTTPLFTAGGNSWSFQNLVTDAGGISFGATLNWTEINVVEGTNYYGYRSQNSSLTATTGNFTTLNAPTGRGATYVIAANDSSTFWKNQADVIVTSDPAQFIRNAAGNITQGTIKLSDGTFSFSGNESNLFTQSNIRLSGSANTTFSFSNSTINLFGTNASHIKNIEIDHIRFVGDSWRQGSPSDSHNYPLLYIQYADALYLHDNYANATYGTPFYIGTVAGQNSENLGVRFDNNHIAASGFISVGLGGYGVIFNTVKDGWITNNLVENTGVNGIGASYFGSSRIHVIGNTVRNSGHGAIALTPGINSEVIGNTIEGGAYVSGNEPAIEVQSKHAGNPFLQGSANNTISGNTISGFLVGIMVSVNINDTEGAIVGVGNYTQNGTRIGNNVLANCSIGILTSNWSYGSDIRGNTFYGCTINVSDNGTNTVKDDNGLIMEALLYNRTGSTWNETHSISLSTYNYTYTTQGGNFTTVNSTLNASHAAVLDTTNAFTFEAWVKPASQGGSSQGRIMDKSSGTTGYLINLQGTNTLRFGVYVSNTLYTIIPVSNSLPLNAWTHVVATFDGTNMNLYLNGIAATPNATGGVMTSTLNTDLQIGNRGLLDRNFDGLIGEARVYNRALTAGEIQTVLKNTSWRYSY